MLPILSLKEKIFYDMINRDEKEGRKNIHSCHIEVYIFTLQKHILLSRKSVHPYKCWLSAGYGCKLIVPMAAEL